MIGNFKKLSVRQLLITFGAVLDELKDRGVVKTRNNPVADYAEWLVAEKLGLSIQTSSNAGFDAIDAKGVRYQIKSRRLSDVTKSRQLGVIRNLKKKEFDFLIGVIFNSEFSVLEAYKIPHCLIAMYAPFSPHQNGNILQLNGEILTAKGVERIDKKLSGPAS
ncbi:MAG: hypothetical protein PHO34_00095 [Candidatus Omnitrophica bacterium]|nr:hypothetical protein [Candidatus Omnitrophota bacterium]MDD5042317.1 hypothetical protein [Candidatus Omnitrophota bacterium]MDD5500458.1 hypothetical protein [Candidatus Omnitrophota bacterium]